MNIPKWRCKRVVRRVVQAGHLQHCMTVATLLTVFWGRDVSSDHQPCQPLRVFAARMVRWRSTMHAPSDTATAEGTNPTS